MKGKPILFNGPMVRALLSGDKNQTRRVVKPHPSKGCDKVIYDPAIGWRFRGGPNVTCPYGKPGGLLWVRESFGIEPERYIQPSRNTPVGGTFEEEVFYRAHDGNLPGMKWKPSIHMPRWASRLTLRITDVRVERVQDISEDGALSEGIRKHQSWGGAISYRADGLSLKGHQTFCARDAFAALWNALNAKRGYGWDENPWVFVIEFEVIRQNIDEVQS